MAVSGQITIQGVWSETFSTGVPGVQDPSLKHNQFKMSGGNFDATTTPPVAEIVDMVGTLSGGALTIDLTALVGANGVAVDMTGLKLQWLYLENLGAAAMTIQGGASNGYELFGASGLFVLPPGAKVGMFMNDGTPDVASGDRTIDIAGSGTQQLNIQFVFG